MDDPGRIGTVTGSLATQQQRERDRQRGGDVASRAAMIEHPRHSEPVPNKYGDTRSGR